MELFEGKHDLPGGVPLRRAAAVGAGDIRVSAGWVSGWGFGVGGIVGAVLVSNGATGDSMGSGQLLHRSPLRVAVHG